MFLLTEELPAVACERTYQKGLGFWSDPRNGRTFFYCAFRSVPIEPSKPLPIIRFDVREPASRWQFLGQLDFDCMDLNVSSCGLYLWSINLSPRNQRTSFIQPIFRQINPNTLQYTVFDVMPAGKDNLRSTQFQLFWPAHVLYSFQN